MVERAARNEKKTPPDHVLDGFKWYGSIANIQPNVFNVAVDVFEAIQPLDLTLSSDAYADFAASYQFESDHGHSHRVSGDIVCRAGDVAEVLLRVFRRSPT